MKKKLFLFGITIFLGTIAFGNVCINWSSPDEFGGGAAICTVACMDGSKCSVICKKRGCAAGCFEGGGCFAKCIDKMPGVKVGRALTYAMHLAKQSFLLDPNSVDIDPDVWNFKSHRQFLTVTILAGYANVPQLEGSNWKLFDQIDPVAVHFEDLNNDGKDDMILKFDAETVKEYLGALPSDDYSFFVSTNTGETLYVGFLNIKIKND